MDDSVYELTIITPVWNSVETIEHCIRSIAEQTKVCQHIIIDGGSTDGTLETIEKNRSSASIVVTEPDQGMYDAINKGLKLTEGEIVGILNADDYYPTNDVLGKVAGAFADPNIEACYGDLLYVDRQDAGKVVRTWTSGVYRRDKFYYGWMPPHPTFFLRKSMYDVHGGYRLDLGSAADYEVMLRMLLKHRANAAYIPQILVHMRNEGMSNASLRNRIKANRYDRKAWRVNDIRPKPWTLIAKPLGKLGQWLEKA